ncbi:MAG: DUF2855 family protein [Halieaceae bacterium]
MHTTTFEVDRANPSQTRVREQELAALEPDEVLLAIDRFALTSNNISYAVAGEMLGYWNFFPTDEGWGRVPAMGYADVIESRHPDIAVGERLWGFYPMGSHLKVKAGSVDAGGFSDVSEHREGLAPIYARFDRQPPTGKADPHREDLTMLLRGLFLTSWLVEDFMFDNEYFGASQYVVTSASSKTAIALAFAIKQRGQLRSIGLTSASNVEFVKGLGCYDEVLAYEQVSSLDNTQATISVDMAGSHSVLASIHKHFGEQLKYSCLIGATHHEDGGDNSGLPGAEPTFFFAPSQVEKRVQDWGGAVLFQRIGEGLREFQDFCKPLINVVRRGGPHCLEKIYLKVLEGRADPSDGYVLSITDPDQDN